MRAEGTGTGPMEVLPGQGRYSPSFKSQSFPLEQTEQLPWRVFFSKIPRPMLLKEMFREKNLKRASCRSQVIESTNYLE